jgi:hypothetical protein
LLVKETKTAGTMPRDQQYLKIHALNFLRRCFVDNEVRPDGLDLEGEAEPFEEIGVGEHLHGILMATELAPVLALDAGGVEDVVDMAVGEEQCFHFQPLLLQPVGGGLRGVDEDAVFLDKKAVCVENTACVGFNAHLQAQLNLIPLMAQATFCKAGAYFRLEMCYNEERAFDLFAKPVSVLNF